MKVSLADDVDAKEKMMWKGIKGRSSRAQFK